jgi:hypothetical protein
VRLQSERETVSPIGRLLVVRRRLTQNKLSAADREYLGDLLDAIAADKKVCDRFLLTLTSRPPRRGFPGLKMALHARLLGLQQNAIALRTRIDVASAWGVTETIVARHGRTYRKEVDLILNGGMPADPPFTDLKELAAAATKHKIHNRTPR